MENPNQVLVDSRSRTLITNLCKTLLQIPRVILLLGEPGYGKSANLEDVASQEPSLYIIRPYKSWKVLRIFRTLLQKLAPKHAAVRSNDMYDIMQAICSTINKMKTIPCICFDEAGKMPLDSYAHVQELFDLTKGRASYIISSPGYVERKIQKAIKADAASLKEFRRRINEKIELPEPLPHELAEMCKKHGITDLEWINSKVTECETFSDMLNEIDIYKLEKQAEKNGYRQLKINKIAS